MERAATGGAPRVRLAKSCTRSMLSILLNYGAELGLPGCLDLAQVLERMTLRVPLPDTPGMESGEGQENGHDVRPSRRDRGRRLATRNAAPSLHCARSSHAVRANTQASRCGHADTRMVEKHYGHLAPSYIVDAIRASGPRFGIETDGIH
jgi:hypothetical protein